MNLILNMYNRIPHCNAAKTNTSCSLKDKMTIFTLDARNVIEFSNQTISRLLNLDHVRRQLGMKKKNLHIESIRRVDEFLSED